MCAGNEGGEVALAGGGSYWSLIKSLRKNRKDLKKARPRKKIYAHCCLSANKGGGQIFVLTNKKSQKLFRWNNESPIALIRWLFSDRTLCLAQTLGAIHRESDFQSLTKKRLNYLINTPFNSHDISGHLQVFPVDVWPLSVRKCEDRGGLRDGNAGLTAQRVRKMGSWKRVSRTRYYIMLRCSNPCQMLKLLVENH